MLIYLSSHDAGEQQSAVQQLQSEPEQQNSLKREACWVADQSQHAHTLEAVPLLVAAVGVQKLLSLPAYQLSFACPSSPFCQVMEAACEATRSKLVQARSTPCPIVDQHCHIHMITNAFALHMMY